MTAGTYLKMPQGTLFKDPDALTSHAQTAMKPEWLLSPARLCLARRETYAAVILGSLCSHCPQITQKLPLSDMQPLIHPSNVLQESCDR